MANTISNYTERNNQFVPPTEVKQFKKGKDEFSSNQQPVKMLQILNAGRKCISRGDSLERHIELEKEVSNA